MLTTDVAAPASTMAPANGPYHRRRVRRQRITFLLLVVAALAMSCLGLYRPDGLLNTLIKGLGLSAQPPLWLANQSTALGALIAIDLWSGIGFYSVLFFAALGSIPEELYEAARLDGAGYWTILWRIAFPLMLDIFGVVGILQFLYILSGAARN